MVAGPGVFAKTGGVGPGSGGNFSYLHGIITGDSQIKVLEDSGAC